MGCHRAAGVGFRVLGVFNIPTPLMSLRTLKRSATFCSASWPKKFGVTSALRKSLREGLDTVFTWFRNAMTHEMGSGTWDGLGAKTCQNTLLICCLARWHASKSSKVKTLAPSSPLTISAISARRSVLCWQSLPWSVSPSLRLALATAIEGSERDL